MSGNPQAQGNRPLPPGIRLNQIQTLPHLTDQQKATYTRGVASLYEAFQKHDKESQEYRTAAAKLLEFTKKMWKEMNEWKANQASAAAGQPSQPQQRNILKVDFKGTFSPSEIEDRFWERVNCASTFDPDSLVLHCGMAPLQNTKVGFGTLRGAPFLILDGVKTACSATTSCPAGQSILLFAAVSQVVDIINAPRPPRRSTLRRAMRRTSTLPPMVAFALKLWIQAYTSDQRPLPRPDPDDPSESAMLFLDGTVTLRTLLLDVESHVDASLNLPRTRHVVEASFPASIKLYVGPNVWEFNLPLWLKRMRKECASSLLDPPIDPVPDTEIVSTFFFEDSTDYIAVASHRTISHRGFLQALAFPYSFFFMDDCYLYHRSHFTPAFAAGFRLGSRLHGAELFPLRWREMRRLGVLLRTNLRARGTPAFDCLWKGFHLGGLQYRAINALLDNSIESTLAHHILHSVT